MNKILVLDGHNLLHRARSGFQLGDFNVAYNFFRGLKPLIELFDPSRVYFTLEGAPYRQCRLLPEYKANRKVEEGSEEQKSLIDFRRQKELIVNLLRCCFPLSVVVHPHFEADDTVYNIIKRSNGVGVVEWTVVSTDTDFIQLLQQFDNVYLYNPVKKQHVAAPDYDYVYWKALRGDPSDNIPGIPSIGDKTAESIVRDPELISDALKDPASLEIFERNVKLIRLAEWDNTDADLMMCSAPHRDWDRVRETFQAWSFNSMLKDTYWTKFVSVFDKLWNVA